jgi:hypothetical protein
MSAQEITIPKNFGQMSKVFAGAPVENELSQGIQSSFGVVKFRGKVWSITYRGNEFPVLRDDGDGAANSIEVVLVKASPVIGKTFYKHGYQMGSNAAPDCYSNDGVAPDANVPDRQNPICKICKNNVFGSGPNGRGKACADSKRVVVVPVDDMLNEAYGGPMLLRVPPASLQNMAAFGDKLKQVGYPPYAVATRISFDVKVTHPQLVFQAVRALNDDEAKFVLELRDDERVDRILAVPHEDHVEPKEEVKLEDVFEQPPTQPTKAATKSAAASQPKQNAKPQLAATPKPQPQQSKTPSADLRKELAQKAKSAEAEPETVETEFKADESAGRHDQSQMNGSAIIEEGGAEEEVSEEAPTTSELDLALSKLL